VLAALAAFVDTKGACPGYGRTSSADVERLSSQPIPAGIQDQILEGLAARVQPNSGASEAESASHLLLRLCRPESHDAFLAMTHSPLAEIRERGALGLRALGEEPPILPTTPPVAFRILIDGEPLGGTEVEYELRARDGRSTASNELSGDDGVVHLNRDLFMDPKAPVADLQLSSVKFAVDSGAWFSARVAVPVDLDSLTTVEITTQSLTVSLPRGRRGGRIEVQSNRPVFGTEMWWAIGEPLPLPASGTLVLPGLQRGIYRVSATWPDGSAWSSGDLDLGDQPVVVVVGPGAITTRSRRTWSRKRR
jgi:hypothetical protein